jgi:hypothetical protein
VVICSRCPPFSRTKPSSIFFTKSPLLLQPWDVTVSVPIPRPMWSPDGDGENVAISGSSIRANICEIAGNVKPISVAWSFIERQAAPHFVGHSVSRASPFRVSKAGRRDTREIYLGQISIELLTGSRLFRSAASSGFEFGEGLTIKKFTFPSTFVSIHMKRIKRIM